MSDEHAHELPAEWPTIAEPERDPALAALEAAWRTGILSETDLAA
jgi:hypothetical protein